MNFQKKRKRKFAACALGLTLALGASTLLAACSSNGEQPQTPDPDTGIETPAAEKFTVTFVSEDGTVYGTQEVEAGAKATLPTYIDANGNPITQWYYKYSNGATEFWSFAGYTVTEDMTLYAAASDAPVTGGSTYALDASLSAYINAMGGIEFGDGIYVSATVTDLSDGRYLLHMTTDKSQVTIYGVSCDTFIDPEGTNATSDRGIPNGTIGYYDQNGELITEGVSYTLSAENDLVNAPDPEGGTNYTQVRYVTGISMLLNNVGALEDLEELKLSFFINSQVMGTQFCETEEASTVTAATLAISGMTEAIEPEEPEGDINGITDAKIDENGHLILTLSDGTELDAGFVKGDDGVGISNITYADSVLHIYLTNGNHYEFDLSGSGGSDLPDNVSETRASCTMDGVRTTYTDASKTEVLGIRTIERATGHTYENGICTVCGAAQIDDMTFTLNGDEAGYTLTAYTSHAWDTIAIPNTYNGLPVTAIADGSTLMGMVLQSGVFMDHTEIESVALGSNLRAVGIGAFSGCTQLADIDLSNVTPMGAWAFQNCGLTSVSLHDSLAEIPGNAFYGCTGLASIAIPASVTSIGNSAFFSCTSLREIIIPASVASIGNSAFMNTGLTAVTVPSTVTSLGTSVFSGCIELASAEIRANIGTLPTSAFSGCTSLRRFNSDADGVFDLTAFDALQSSVFVRTAVETVEFSSALTSIGSTVFSGCADLTAVDFNENTGAVTFGSQVFQNCTALTEIALPDHSVLGSTMFSGCSSLKEVTLGNQTEQIPANFFQDCISLETIVIPDTVTEINTNAFSGCTSLKSIIFSENSNLTVLRGITGCTSLTSLTVPANVTQISACTGNYALIEIINLSELTLTPGSTENGSIAQYAKNIVASVPESAYVTSGDYTLYRDGNGANEKWYVTAYHGEIGTDGSFAFPESFTIGGEVVDQYEIYTRIFYGNTAVRTLSIPAGVAAIGAYAFANCGNLSSVTFAEDSSLASIGNNAFYNCTSLQEIGLPDSLRSVGSNAFSGCGALPSVDLGEGIQTIGSGAFSSCYALKTLTIPASVTDIHSSAFSSCSLAEVYNLAGDIENIPAAENVYGQEGGSLLVTAGDYTFLYIPAQGDNAAKAYLVSYEGADSMITLPSSFTVGNETVSSYEIYHGAFAYRHFTSVTIPAAVTSIGDYAFYHTDMLSVSFSDASTCTSIGAYAFAYSTVMMFNSSMTAYVLDLEGLQSIGEYAFYYTSNLRTVQLAASVTSIGGRAFAYSAVQSVVFAETRESALSLGSYAFAYMTSLKSISIPAYIAELPQYLFRGCTALTSVVLADGIEGIENYVFRDCAALTSIILPSSMASITSSAFGSSGIEAICLDGAEEDFSGLSIPSSIANRIYYYSEDDPVNDGMYWHYGEDGNVAVWEMI